jgi:3-keto-5-aminohexanoate cleavage enzyme
MSQPVIIEAAISPLRRGIPAQSVDTLVAEADACIQAGAGIIHHHHDMRLDESEAITQLIDTGRRILDRHPGSLIYTDYLAGKRAVEENAHLQPMGRAGVLTMFAIDPGITTFASDDHEGLPIHTYTDGLRFSEAHEMINFSKEVGVPISLGVFEPGHLRWILAYERAVGFSPGTMIKLYFGGTHLVDQAGAAGINFGLPGTPAALNIYLSMMEGSSLPWTVSLFGDPVLESDLARHTLERGGHLRVGIEDAAGMSPLSNAEMVRAAVDLAEAAGRTVVGGAEALRALTGAAAGV